MGCKNAKANTIAHWKMCLCFTFSRFMALRAIRFVVTSLYSPFYNTFFLQSPAHLNYPVEANKQFNLNMALCVHYANYISVCEKHMAN